ncbi:uncharacterized protein PFD1115c-like [Argopecten irradians]|uniref:uncharacterized protein PFD1115c-like n=1 Tax=Argopecten irradians TaxID=31199 RepID=UPI003721ACA6
MDVSGLSGILDFLSEPDGQLSLVYHPLIVEDQPHISEDQPHITEDQPHISENQPHITEDQPHISEDQPHITKDKPHITEDQPHITEDQPQISDYQPHITDDQPHITEDQPQMTSRWRNGLVCISLSRKGHYGLKIVLFIQYLSRMLLLYWILHHLKPLDPDSIITLTIGNCD